MILVGDETRLNGKLPWVTFGIIALNIIVYCAECFLGDSFTRGFGLIPKEISTMTDLTKPQVVRAKVPERIRYEKGKKIIIFREVTITVPQARGPFPIFLTLITSIFLHGNWFHLFVNMWFLALFGRNLECALDHGRFFVFYLASGIIGGLVYTASDASSVIPCVGASGAIAGVMGGYVAFDPLNRISLWVGVYCGVIQLPAFLVVGVWFLIQYIAAFQALEYAGTSLGGTAYWDHVGGFLAGAGIIWGLIFYLRWRQAGLPPAAEEAEPDAEAAEEFPSADPFAACLPQSTAIKCSEPVSARAPSSTAIMSMEHASSRTSDPLPDPLVACLPVNTAVKSLDKH